MEAFVSTGLRRNISTARGWGFGLRPPPAKQGWDFVPNKALGAVAVWGALDRSAQKPKSQVVPNISVQFQSLCRASFVVLVTVPKMQACRRL